MTTTDDTQRSPVTGWRRNLVLFIDRQILGLSRHWLAVFNLLFAVYTLLPALAPVFMAHGAPGLGRLIYVLYSPACHQLPQRSFFLFGPKAVYGVDELWALGVIDKTDIFTLKQFAGSPQVGYKMAMCERDMALYGGLLVGGLVFVLARKRLRPPSLLVYGLCLLPMALDGGTQIFFLRESNWVLRLITGGLAGLSTIWLIYPYVEDAFNEVRWKAQQQVNKA